MRSFRNLRTPLALIAMAAILQAQQVAPPVIVYPAPPPEPSQPAAAQPQAPAAAQPQTAAAQPRLADSGGFLLNNVSLIEMIDILAKRMKINYILDPRVKGTVTVYTYGEVKPVDLMPLMETLLRVNGATMVKVGDMYRIVPLSIVAQLPLDPQTNIDSKSLADDERMVLNLIFLKYVTVSEISKLIQPFLGEGATASTYDPANLLILLDNSRSMKRTMELISLFDSDTFAAQRVRLFEVTNSRPADMVKDLDSVFKAYALSEKNAAVKFIAIDRINTIIAVAPNPGIFTEVDKWLKKLDVAVKITAGSVNNYVYRLKYGRAETIAMAIMALYTGNTFGLMMAANSMNNGGSMGGGMGYGGGTGYGGGVGSMGYSGVGYSNMNYGGGTNYGGMGYGGGYGQQQQMTTTGGAMVAQSGGAVAGALGDLTGSYLGAPGAQGTSQQRIPRVIPNPFDNTLLIQGTPQEYEQIGSLLRQLDLPPRQVLIDAKIYEVDLTGAFAAGVSTYLQKRESASSSTAGTASRVLSALGNSGGLTLTAGALVLRSHELLGVLTASETSQHTRVISSPSIIATDSIPATMNVGQEVPVLTSQAVSGVSQGGTSLFTNTVSNRSSGVTLNVTARVNSSGVVTMVINQDVSTPQAPAPGGINSPSFQSRSFSTQVTVQDGDTIAIGGIIQESSLQSSGGIPVLHKIPILGAAFGSRSTTKARTELIVFLTPRVIYDTNQITDATNELKTSLKRVQKLMKEE